MTNCEENANEILEMLTERVLDRHDGQVGRAEIHFFNIASVDRDNEVIEAAWMAFIQRQAAMWQELAQLAFTAGVAYGQTGGLIPADAASAATAERIAA